jgi:hypothetical protein
MKLSMQASARATQKYTVVCGELTAFNIVQCQYNVICPYGALSLTATHTAAHWQHATYYCYCYFNTNYCNSLQLFELVHFRYLKVQDGWTVMS